MTDLSPAERATVERFEQAPDALADGGCVPCEVCGGSQTRGWHRHEVALTPEQHDEIALCIGAMPEAYNVTDHSDEATTFVKANVDLIATALAPIVARMVAEAADAREAEVRARVAQAIEAHPARWLNADGTTSPILPATTASAAPPEPNNVPSQAYLKALVAAEQDRLRAEGWRACVDHIRRVYASWLMPEDTYWVGRHNPYRAALAPADNDGEARNG